MSSEPTVVFVLHPRVDPKDPALVAAREQVEAAGERVEVVIRRPPPPGERVQQKARLDEPGALEGVKLVATFGGDGTFLYAARAAIPAEVPLLGVNLGRLGFLAWVDIGDAPDALASWTAGRCEVEMRPTMAVAGAVGEGFAINELALVKDPAANVIQVEVDIDGVTAGMFHADGALVATPTGSTGYALSAGGPLLDPHTVGLVFVPLNAHNLASRPLVVSPDATVVLSVDEPTRVVVDGAESVVLDPHDRVSCRLDGPAMRLVRAPGSYGFYEQLQMKLGWGRPLVREGRR